MGEEKESETKKGKEEGALGLDHDLEVVVEAVERLGDRYRRDVAV